MGFPEASSSYNFIYSRFPSTAGSGPSSPSRDCHLPAVGVLLVGRGFRDRYPAPPLAAAQMGSGSESPGPRRRRQHRLTQADLSFLIRFSKWRMPAGAVSEWATMRSKVTGRLPRTASSASLSMSELSLSVDSRTHSNDDGLGLPVGVWPITIDLVRRSPDQFMEWQRTIRKKNGETRKQFLGWFVPPAVRKNLGVEDGSECSINLNLGGH